MAEPAAPPQGNKKRQRMILIGAAAVGLLVLLYLRSQGQSSPNATSSTDLQTASMAAAQQQAAQDAAMYGSSNIPGGGGGGFGGGGGVDPTAITDAITQGFDTVAQNTATNTGSAIDPVAPGTFPAGDPGAATLALPNTGQPAGNPAGPGPRVAQITTHRGGAFYNWWEHAYHTRPPAHISNQDPRYLAWTHRPRVRPRRTRR